MLQCRIRGRLAMGASLCALVADTLSGCKTYEAALGTGASVTAIDSARLTQSGFLTNYAKLKSVVAMQGIECWRDTRFDPKNLKNPDHAYRRVVDRTKRFKRWQSAYG